MAKISKFFRVAVEGATCDGRTIDRALIADMAATYNRDTYAARVNMEHIRGFSAEPPFNAYGDVIALKTEEVELDVGGKKVKKLALFAQIEPTDALVQLNAKKQKLYTSVEINPNFAATGKAYLQGLAVTDSPASLGTEMLQFAAKQGENNPFASRKIDKGNFISEALEADIVLEDKSDPAPSEHSGLFAAATAFFKQFAEPKKEEPVTPPAQTPPPANDNASFAALAQGMEKMFAGIDSFTKKMDADLGALRGEVTTLRSQIDNTDRDPGKRPPATGGDGKYSLTDC